MTVKGFTDFDRCGVDTPWGCGRYLIGGEPGHVIHNATRPRGGKLGNRDNGSRLFHADCCPHCQTYRQCSDDECQEPRLFGSFYCQTHDAA